jgi:hypothetical protein
MAAKTQFQAAPGSDDGEWIFAIITALKRRTEAKAV